MDEVFASKQNDYLELSQAISLHLGLSHYQLGYLLLHKWQLPDVYQAILNHFEDSELTACEAEQIRILRASQRLCCLLLSETDDSQNERLLELADNALLPLASISRVYDDLWQKKQNIQELAEVMGQV